MWSIHWWWGSVLNVIWYSIEVQGRKELVWYWQGYFCDPAFARLSAASLPATPLCPGTCVYHTYVYVCVCVWNWVIVQHVNSSVSPATPSSPTHFTSIWRHRLSNCIKSSLFLTSSFCTVCQPFRFHFPTHSVIAECTWGEIGEEMVDKKGRRGRWMKGWERGKRGIKWWEKGRRGMVSTLPFLEGHLLLASQTFSNQSRKKKKKRKKKREWGMGGWGRGGGRGRNDNLEEWAQAITWAQVQFDDFVKQSYTFTTFDSVRAVSPDFDRFHSLWDSGL